MVERRKVTRVGLISKVQIQQTAPEVSSSIAWGADLSEGGIELLAVNPLKVGEEVSLQISVSSSDMPISVKGRVVWAQPTQAGHRIGMQFQEVEALAQARILQLVTERLARLPAAIPSPATLAPASQAASSAQALARDSVGCCSAGPAPPERGTQTLDPGAEGNRDGSSVEVGLPTFSGGPGGS